MPIRAAFYIRQCQRLLAARSRCLYAVYDAQRRFGKRHRHFPVRLPHKLRTLQQTKNFGRYGVGDSVPVNFLATTDIIGGNSGSPILNAYGEQVGIVFDGNYEGLGNDLFFDPNYGRTIVVDIRYVLFVTEKFADAKWIVDEMTLKGGNTKAAKK